MRCTQSNVLCAAAARQTFTCWTSTPRARKSPYSLVSAASNEEGSVWSPRGIPDDALVGLRNQLSQPPGTPRVCSSLSGERQQHSGRTPPSTCSCTATERSLPAESSSLEGAGAKARTVTVWVCASSTAETKEAPKQRALLSRRTNSPPGGSASQMHCAFGPLGPATAAGHEAAARVACERIELVAMAVNLFDLRML